MTIDRAKLVPREPTHEMLDAVVGMRVSPAHVLGLSPGVAVAAWKAMYDAAPVAAQEPPKDDALDAMLVRLSWRDRDRLPGDDLYDITSDAIRKLRVSLAAEQKKVAERGAEIAKLTMKINILTDPDAEPSAGDFPCTR